MKRVLIIANGELDPGMAPRLASLPVDRLIAVDGGAGHCRSLGLVPDLVIGDLDSLTPETLEHVVRAGAALERHPARKDETDLELALGNALRQGAEYIVLACALGGRLDMTLANVLFLARPEFRDIRIELWEARRTTWLLRPPGGEIHGFRGDTLSLIPLQGDAEGVVTEGLAYPLRDETLRFGQARGLSNVFTGMRARVRLRGGMLLVVHTSGRA
jgi:thiamine pyrophosphokinase